MSIKLYALGILAILALIITPFCFYTVDSGERAIVRTFGSVSNIEGDGIHVRMPLVHSITKVNIRTLKAEAPAEAGTKDMQIVHTKVAMNYHIDPNKIAEIYTQTGLELEDKVIDPRIQETVKAIIARYNAEQLLSLREKVKQEIAALLKTSVSPYHIIVEDIQITNFQFSAAFNGAIEAKQVAEQSALKAKNDLDRIKVEAEQKIATAMAEAETIRIQANAIRAQGGKEYVELKAIEKWDGKLPTYMTSGSAMPFVSVK